MSFFKTLTTGKKVTRDAMTPVLDKLKEHLIKKNVAVEIADKLCESVAVKLEGKVISNFTGMKILKIVFLYTGLHLEGGSRGGHSPLPPEVLSPLLEILFVLAFLLYSIKFACSSVVRVSYIVAYMSVFYCHCPPKIQ